MNVLLGSLTLILVEFAILFASLHLVFTVSPKHAIILSVLYVTRWLTTAMFTNEIKQLQNKKEESK